MCTTQKRNANRLEDECHGTYLQGKGDVKGVKLLRAHQEDYRKGAEKENTSNGKSGKDAIWIYAGKGTTDAPFILLGKIQEEYCAK